MTLSVVERWKKSHEFIPNYQVLGKSACHVRLAGAAGSTQNDASMVEQQRDVSVQNGLRHECVKCQRINAVLLCTCTDRWRPIVKLVHNNRRGLSLAKAETQSQNRRVQELDSWGEGWLRCILERKNHQFLSTLHYSPVDFNGFASVLGVTVYGQVGLKQQQGPSHCQSQGQSHNLRKQTWHRGWI